VDCTLKFERERAVHTSQFSELDSFEYGQTRFLFVSDFHVYMTHLRRLNLLSQIETVPTGVIQLNPGPRIL
jgi:hypothetical protein